MNSSQTVTGYHSPRSQEGHVLADLTSGAGHVLAHTQATRPAVYLYNRRANGSL